MEKYYDSEVDIVTIMENGYGRSLEKIERLKSVALTDFPDLQLPNINLVVFGPPRHERMIGIQFVPTEEPPDTYERYQSRVLCDYYLL